jgi:hypothetical protein
MPRDRRRELAIEMLRERWCEWPDCRCNQVWDHWSRNLPTAMLTEEEAVAVREQIYLMLECMACRCPERRMRLKAKQELMHPIFLEEATPLEALNDDRLVQANSDRTVRIGPLSAPRRRSNTEDDG